MATAESANSFLQSYGALMSYCLDYHPFQWRGSKARLPTFWQALDDFDVYCEPFGGRHKVLFSRPESRHKHPVEVVGDRDAMITIFFRADRNSGRKLAPDGRQ